MEPEKFENNVKKVLGEREIQPSAAAWEKLEQRLAPKKEKRPYLLWLTSAAAIAAIFFVLGSHFNSPIASEEPQLVEQTAEEPVLQEKTSEPEVIHLASSEEKEELKEQEKPSAKGGVKNVIFEAPVKKSSEAETAVAVEDPSELIQEPSESIEVISLPETAIAREEMVPGNTDLEVEALLLLATAELKADSTYTVKAGDLLHQVEYELDQSFREKVFDVVKDGFRKAKTAVATRDLRFN
ncbi:hypothetical protein [Salinimicrobium sp. HB62]|uniref:hypothetical protein n=1 Tax=Salinimicrobium sp. HB62 TaxID=3077781 RepID=UPI002D78470B|nr:hypothetical protein [Salinimicrobium sp. HB62]